jgi:tetratricopeptide (TPR) repeat protein
MKKIVFGLVVALLVSACSSQQQKPSDFRMPEPDAAYYFIRGYESEMSHDWAEAEKHYLKALAVDPESVYLRIQFAYLLVRMGRADEGVATADAVLRDQPDNIPALKFKGDLFRDQKKYQSAIEIYLRLAALQADPPDILFMLSLLFYYNDEHERSGDMLEKIITRDPGAYNALDLLGSVLLDKKEYDRAEGYLKKAIEVNPNLDTAYFKLGLIAEIRERIDEAIRNYEETVRINPYNSQARQRLAQAYLRLKISDKALEELRVISRQSPENAEVHVRMGMVLFEEKQFDKALEEFNAALHIRPDNAMVLYYMSLVFEETGRYDEAVAALKKVVSAEPSNINAFLHLAYIYDRQKKDDDAIRIYEEILSFEKEKPEVYLYLANTLMHKKDFRRAEALLNGALEKFSDHDELLFSLAVVYEKTDRFDDMVAKLRKVIEINPKSAEALNYLGYSFADRNIQLEEAYSLVQRALELKPGNAYYLDSLGWVYFRQGRLTQALETILRSVETAKDDPVLYEHLGDIYLALGQSGKADEAWKKALQLHEKEEGLKERVEKKLRDTRREEIK